jgi:molybdenum ABC transporter molybdate-binding protein
VRDGWIIYAILGVLVCILLWRVATQWKVRSTEAANLRVSVVIIFGVGALVLVVGQYMRLASSIAAHSQDKTITVFAAASMTNALDDVDAAFTKQTGIKVVTSYDASSALMKQIEGGAAADAFVSADLKWMKYGKEKKVINERTCINLLGNVLVLIAGKASKIDHADIEPGLDLAKLAGDGRIATGDVKEVPVGLYAKAALEKLGVWQNGHDSQCPGRSSLRRARRGAARHRLCDRCQDRARRESRRRFPRQYARSDHLSGSGDSERQTGDDAISGVSAVCGSQIDI